MSKIEEKIKVLEKLLDNPRTGLRDSSDTNKTRHAIIALMEEAYQLGRCDDDFMYQTDGTLSPEDH